jgi:hypothetical protein
MKYLHPSRFVIVTMSRSGTSLLSETLNSHSQIVCHGEVYHPNPVWHIKDKFVERSFEEVLKFRAADPVAYLEWVYQRPDVAAVGFKMWRSQNPEVCDALLADESVSKIIYERTNVLARYSSSNLVHASGVYNMGKDQKRSKSLDQKVAFDLHKFRATLAKHRDGYTNIRQRAKGHVLDLTYDGLVSGGFADILAFLGVGQTDLTPQKQKLHGSDILNRFEDTHHAEIRAELVRIGHEEWCRE